MIGQTISHYKILEKLGEGGMGVVYKAHDLKLDRHVALKFLPPELTRDPDAKERFVHEAKAASSLQHHNICTIHDIDQTPDGPEGTGQMFIVMDLYEGETLKSRIAAGKMKIEGATDIAIQIAQGLAEAHEHGITHRDIKPANVIVTKGGIAKIVDFGLAKLSGATKVTKTGSTLGTVAYMAPEQLQDAEVDARADIYSLGVVLYEMLTGKTPFRGDHAAALMYSIMNDEPEPLQTHVPDATSELIHVVNRALEKDPGSRYKTMDDLLIDLRRVRKETSKVSMPAIGKSKQSFVASRGFVAIVSVALLACVAIMYFVLNQPRKPPRLNPDRTVRQVPQPMELGRYFTLSPDGRWIAFSGIENGKWDIYFMNSSGGGIRRVTYDNSAQAFACEFSRDGASLLYMRLAGSSWEIGILPVLGGQFRFIASGFGAQFFPKSSKIIYLRSDVGGTEQTESGKPELCTVNIDGSEKRVVFVDPGYTDLSEITGDFCLSPDGTSIAWIKTFRNLSQDIITYDLESKKEVRVTFSGTPKDEVSWTSDNYLIYSSFANGNFDLWMCPAEGGSQQQLTSTRLDELRGELSEDGSKLLYYEQNLHGNVRMMDLESGKVTPLTSDDRNRLETQVSPDGRYVACLPVGSYPALHAIWGIQVLDTKGESPIRTICEGERTNTIGGWSQDGAWIAYSTYRDSAGGPVKICIVSPSGSRSKVIAKTKEFAGYSSSLRWVGRDTLIWFSELRTWICSINDSNLVQFYQDSTFAIPILDGKCVVFFDFRVGRGDWWIDTAPAAAGKSRTSATKLLGVVNPAIAPSGRFLLYQSKPGELTRVSLPDGRRTKLPFCWPSDSYDRRISYDGKTVFYVEGENNSKLMLWENPFVKE